MKAFFGNRIVQIGLLAAVILIAWYFWQNRWKKFSDNGQAGALSLLNGGADIGGGLGIVANEPHGLKVGDRVIIKQDAGAKWPQYDGQATVAYIITDKIFAVHKPFAGNSPVNPGKFKKA